MSDAAYPLTGKFLQGRLRHAMTEREKGIVEGLVDRIEVLDGDKLLLERGDLCNVSTILIEGYMLRCIKGGGEDHIVGIQVPGDFVDLHAFALKRLDHDIRSLGRTRIGCVPHDALREVLRDEPHLSRLLWFSTLLDAAIHREWIMKTSQLRAAGRVAHLIAEIWYRLRMVDLGRSNGFQTPLNQTHLASICGISTIHVSRTLRDLREGGVVDFRRGRIEILDGEKLKKLGRFDPTYLYGEGVLAVGDSLDLPMPEVQAVP